MPGTPALVCSLVAALVVLTVHRDGAWHSSHEQLRYPALVEHFYNGWRAGDAWPRWLPEMHGGYGYPQFVFYQPLFFFVAAAFRALLGNPVSGCFGAIGFSLALGSWGCFRLCGRGENAWLGALGAAGFLMMPYVWIDLLVRGDLSELLAIALCPWALAPYLELALSEASSFGPSHWRATTSLAISLALLLLAHPIVGVLLGVLLPLGLPALLVPPGRGARFLSLSIAAMGAVLLSSPYWLPHLAAEAHAQMNIAFEAFRAHEHTVRPDQFLAGTWGLGSSAPTGQADTMSFRLGGLWLGLAAIGSFLGARRRDTRLLTGLLLLTIVAITPLAEPLWKLAPFSLMQFPWRLLSIAVILQLALLRGWALAPDSLRGKHLRIGIALLVAVAGWQTEQFVPSPLVHSRKEIRAKVKSASEHWDTLDYGEFTPKLAPRNGSAPRGKGALFSAPDAHSLAVRQGTAEHSGAWWNRGWTLAEITSDRPIRVTILQHYFPGFRVVVNGIELSDERLRRNVDAEGRMSVGITPRADGLPVLVGVKYGHPPRALLGYALASSSVVIGWIAHLLLRRRWARSTTADRRSCETGLVGDQDSAFAG